MKKARDLSTAILLIGMVIATLWALCGPSTYNPKGKDYTWPLDTTQSSPDLEK